MSQTETAEAVAEAHVDYVNSPVDRSDEQIAEMEAFDRAHPEFAEADAECDRESAIEITQ